MERIRTGLLVALLASLAVPLPIGEWGGLRLTPTEPLAALCVLAAALRPGLRLPPRSVLAAFGLIALAAAANGASEPLRLLLLAYTLALLAIGHNLGQGRVVLAGQTWVAAAAVPALFGAIAVILSLWGWAPGPALHPFGSLPPGPYPRIQSTFAFPAMLANYLGVALVLLLWARQHKKVAPATFLLLLLASILCLAFTLTPGLGAVILSVALWLRYGSGAGRWVVVTGGFLFALSVLVAAVTPFPQPGASPLASVAGYPVYPSVRLYTWMDAWQVFRAHPWIGAGLTGEPIAVSFIDPGGNGHRLTDAHNLFLNVAAQTGIVGLASIVLLIAVAVRTAVEGASSSITRALAIAWIGGFAAGGMTGSFEDARHLWILFGLMLASRHSSGVDDPLKP